MPDFRIVDDAEQHPKLRAAGLAACGLWSMAGARSMHDLTDGWIAEHYVVGWPSGKRHATTLVNVGLWSRETRQGVPGYRFHDWGHVQRTAAQIETERARSRDRKAASRRPSRPPSGPRPPDVTPHVTAGHPPDFTPDNHRTNGVTHNGHPPSVTAESRRPPYPQHPEGVAGGESSGKQRAGTATLPPDQPSEQEQHERQPCGRRHNPDRPCGGCAAARRAADQDLAEADAAAAAERAAARRKAENCQACNRTGGWLEHPESREPLVRCDHETDPQQQVADALDHAS